jgi:mannose-6-phosphate isomerase-like protein (cupin superfamily)
MASILRPEEGEILSVLGARIRILADGRVTGGKFVAFEGITQPGNGPPLHRHGREDEFFFIIEGTMKFIVDGKETVVTAGSAVYAPRGSVHTFANVGPAPSRMVTVCCPAGMEEPFRDVDQLTREGRATSDAITAAFKRAALDIVGPPILAAAAARA